MRAPHRVVRPPASDLSRYVADGERWFAIRRAPVSRSPPRPYHRTASTATHSSLLLGSRESLGCQPMIRSRGALAPRRVAGPSWTPVSWGTSRDDGLLRGYLIDGWGAPGC